jgi:hypothetical protein
MSKGIAGGAEGLPVWKMEGTREVTVDDADEIADETAVTGEGKEDDMEEEALVAAVAEVAVAARVSKNVFLTGLNTFSLLTETAPDDCRGEGAEPVTAEGEVSAATKRSVIQCRRRGGIAWRLTCDLAFALRTLQLRPH